MRHHMPGGRTRQRPAATVAARTFALAITVVVAFSCAAASSALAATHPEWLLAGKALTAKHAVEWKNQTVTLEYGGSAPDAFEVTCKTSGEGNAYPPESLDPELSEIFPFESKIAVTKMTFTCETPKSGKCTKAKLEGYAGGTSPHLISEGSRVLVEKGLFTLVVDCEAGVEKVKDECSDHTSTLVTNESTGVLASLEGNNLACTSTKEGSSWLHGKITLVATGSSKLSVS
jgi:hypothetical protein